jgi:hypothetical protein
MIYPGKENVPFLMLLRGDGPGAAEVLWQQFNIGHALHGKLPPVRQTAAAAFATDLKCKKVRHAFLNTVILRLHDSIFTVVCKTQQASLMDGRQNKIMNSSVHTSRRWVPYYANRPAHCLTICEFRAVEDRQPHLS